MYLQSDPLSWNERGSCKLASVWCLIVYAILPVAFICNRTKCLFAFVMLFPELFVNFCNNQFSSYSRTSEGNFTSNPEVLVRLIKCRRGFLEYTFLLLHPSKMQRANLNNLFLRCFLNSELLEEAASKFIFVELSGIRKDVQCPICLVINLDSELLETPPCNLLVKSVSSD
uniref:Uncharacterized protein n=1 Tax=Cucumis melo TaxID=3656 RepID=A0A9I9EKJ7_CUCME